MHGCAALAAWRWFGKMYRPETAAALGLALAVNWTWGRTGGAIQSEPLYLLLSQLAVLGAVATARRGGARAGMALGALLAACVLTRHVAAALAAAVVLELLIRRRVPAALSAAFASAMLLAPWAVWLRSVRENTQAGLIGRGNLIGLVATQAFFYLQRLPDAIAGPFVEIATVFGRSKVVAAGATAWAALATGLLVVGWARSFRNPRRRLAALISACTLALLLIWPFTEAGRFLIPLVPCLLVGATEGLTACLKRLPRRAGFPPLNPPPQGGRAHSAPSPLAGEDRGGGSSGWTLRSRHALTAVAKAARLRRPRVMAAWLMLAASLPYALYALTTDRAKAQRRTHAGFDAACSWIAREGDVPGPVLTRHPGEVYWQTGRRAVVPDNPEAIEATIERFGVAYLLVDEERYANAPASSLAAFVGRHPRRAREVWRSDGGRSSVAVFVVAPPSPSLLTPAEPQRRGASNVSRP